MTSSREWPSFEAYERNLAASGDGMGPAERYGAMQAWEHLRSVLNEPTAPRLVGPHGGELVRDRRGATEIVCLGEAQDAPEAPSDAPAAARGTGSRGRMLRIGRLLCDVRLSRFGGSSLTRKKDRHVVLAGAHLVARGDQRILSLYLGPLSVSIEWVSASRRESGATSHAAQ